MAGTKQMKEKLPQTKWSETGGRKEEAMGSAIWHQIRHRPKIKRDKRKEEATVAIGWDKTQRHMLVSVHSSTTIYTSPFTDCSRGCLSFRSITLHKVMDNAVKCYTGVFSSLTRRYWYTTGFVPYRAQRRKRKMCTSHQLVGNSA